MMLAPPPHTPDISYFTDMKLTRRANISLGIFFFIFSITGGVLCTLDGNAVMADIQFFLAGFVLAELIDLILS